MSLAWLVYSSVGAKFDSLLKQKSLAYIFCGIRFFFFFSSYKFFAFLPQTSRKKSISVFFASLLENFLCFANFAISE